MIRQFDTPISTGDLSIDRVLAAKLPVLLLFFAKQLPRNWEETLNQLASQHAGALLVAKIDADANPGSVKKYKVGALPALVAVRDQQVMTQADASSAQEVAAHVAYLLGKGPKPAVRPATQSDPAASSGKPLAVSEATFDKEVMRAPLPVLVDFWAPWCGPCRMVEPILERMATDLAGKLRIAKVNVDENQNLSMRHGVQGIPTMMVVKEGRIVDRWSGALAEAQLRQRVSRWLGGAGL